MGGSNSVRTVRTGFRSLHISLKIQYQEHFVFRNTRRARLADAAVLRPAWQSTKKHSANAYLRDGYPSHLPRANKETKGAAQLPAEVNLQSRRAFRIDATYAMATRATCLELIKRRTALHSFLQESTCKAGGPSESMPLCNGNYVSYMSGSSVSAPTVSYGERHCAVASSAN